jgi:hypothetical protein
MKNKNETEIGRGGNIEGKGPGGKHKLDMCEKLEVYQLVSFVTRSGQGPYRIPSLGWVVLFLF